MKKKFLEITILGLFLTSMVWANSSAFSSQKAFLSLYDYYLDGQKKVWNYAKKKPVAHATKNMEQLIEHLQKSTVNLEIHLASDDGHTWVEWSSGVIMDEGTKIRTAGHSTSGKVTKIVISAFQNQMREAHRFEFTNTKKGHSIYRDEATINIEDQALPAEWSVIKGRVQSNDEIIVMGYPEHLGQVKKNDLVQAFAANQTWVRPLVLVSQVQKVQKTTFIMDPKVGSIFTGGGSGGPAFNLKGEMVGNFVSYLMITDAQSRPSYQLKATHISPNLPEHIAELEQHNIKDPAS